jgi:hypothetical protein
MGKAIVDRFSGILFEMQPRYPDAPATLVHVDLKAAARGKGPVELRDLISLR